MRRVCQTFAFIAITVALAGARPAAQTASLQGDFLKEWAGQKDTLSKIAAAMPEDKYGYKPTPAQRSFGEHVLHIAQVNMMLFQTFASKVPAPQIDMKATSKAATMKAMNDSFDYGTAIIKEQTDQTMAGTITGPPWMGPSTRARMVAFLIGHTQDTYGQMAVYLRLNGLVPPASQRP
jgi:uncharacterized damage-inducible protein DinB